MHAVEKKPQRLNTELFHPKEKLPIVTPSSDAILTIQRIRKIYYGSVDENTSQHEIREKQKATQLIIEEVWQTARAILHYEKGLNHKLDSRMMQLLGSHPKTRKSSFLWSIENAKPTDIRINVENSSLRQYIPFINNIVDYFPPVATMRRKISLKEPDLSGYVGGGVRPATGEIMLWMPESNHDNSQMNAIKKVLIHELVHATTQTLAHLNPLMFKQLVFNFLKLCIKEPRLVTENIMAYDELVSARRGIKDVARDYFEDGIEFEFQDFFKTYFLELPQDAINTVTERMSIKKNRSGLTIGLDEAMTDLIAYYIYYVDNDQKLDNTMDEKLKLFFLENLEEIGKLASNLMASVAQATQN